MSLGIAVGVEILAAKSLDYVGSTVSRLPDSPNEPFFANMARLGIQQGWDGTGKALPWWYGALSAGMTGSTDFIAGQVLGSLLRTQVMAALDENPGLKAALGGKIPAFEQVLAALHGKDVPGMSQVRASAFKELIQKVLHDGDGAMLQKLLDAPEVEIRAPVTRHLRAALVNTDKSEFAGFVERNLLSERPMKGGAIGGSIVGHGIAGAATGVLTGHPMLGALVTLLDSLTEGLLAQKAISGRYEALTTIKCSMLLQGIRDAESPPDWKGKLSNKLIGLYSQMGEEVRLFGEDLYRLAAAADVLADEKLPALNQELAGVIGEEVAKAAPVYSVPPPVAQQGTEAVKGWAKQQVEEALDKGGASLTNLVRAQVRAARTEIEHHAGTNVRTALVHDFAEERAFIEAELQKLADQATAEYASFMKDHPKLAAYLEKPRSDSERKALAPLASFSRKLLERATALAHGATHAGRVTFDKSVAGVGKVVDAALDSTTAQAIGNAILAVADAYEEHLYVPMVMGVELLKETARDAAFTGLRVGGNAGVRVLLAGERFANKNAEQIAALREKLDAIGARIYAQAIHAMLRLQKSASAGAIALVDLSLKASGGLDPELARFIDAKTS